MPKTLKAKHLSGEEIMQSRISMASTRVAIYTMIAETKCDIIYIGCQHSASTDGDSTRICDAAAKKDAPVLLWVKHTQRACRVGNYCGLGVFAIKRPQSRERR